MGNLVGTRTTSAAAATPTNPGLGQSGRPFEFIDGHLVIRARGDAAVHTVERLLVEYGRVGPTHPLCPGIERPTSADRGGDHHLVGGHRRWLECGSNSVRLGRQTKGAPDPCKTTPTRRLRRCTCQSPANCGMTH